MLRTADSRGRLSPHNPSTPIHDSSENENGLITEMRPFPIWTNFTGRRTNASIATGYTLNELPQPQVLFTFGFSNLKPAPSSVST